MKKLFFFFLMLPICASAQNFEITDMVGYSREFPSDSYSIFYGEYQYRKFSEALTNKLQLDYRIRHFLSIHVIYKMNLWNMSSYSRMNDNILDNNFGIGVDFTGKHIYVGDDVYYSIVKNQVQTLRSITYTVSNKNSLSPTLHLGYKAKIAKHFFTNVQIEGSYLNSTQTVVEGNYAPFTQKAKSTVYASIIGGISYHFK